jgi:hypothetical protein
VLAGQVDTELGRGRVHAADPHPHRHSNAHRPPPPRPPTATPEPPAQLGGLIWDDLNEDGIRQPQEPGIGLQTVTLYDQVGAAITATLTISPTGLYTFTVQPGSYALGFELVGGFHFSPQNQGSNPELDSDADPATGRTVTFSLAGGQLDRSWSAGMRPQFAPPPSAPPGTPIDFTPSLVDSLILTPSQRQL